MSRRIIRDDMPYANSVIYFWTGTGNSYRVATWMGGVAEGMGLTTRVLSIDRCNPEEDIRDGNDSLIGIVFPTHGFTVPWHVLRFVWRVPRRCSTHALCVATRAGLKIGNAFVPGVSGSATFVIALILMLKGYSVRGSLSVDMPSNWFSLHPIQGSSNQKAIIDRANKKVVGFINKVLNGSTVWLTANNVIETAWGAFLSVFSLGYVLIGRLFLAKLFFANKNCDGCGVCARYCSVEAIKMRGKEHPRPFWKYNCESCMRCSAFCPHNAVEAGHSWGVILYFIIATPVTTYLFSRLDGAVPGIGDLEGSWVGDLATFLYCYPAMFISYYVFNTLLRIPAVNWIFARTTLTHLSFWGRYREPNTRLNSIAPRHSAIGDRSGTNISPNQGP